MFALLMAFAAGPPPAHVGLLAGVPYTPREGDLIFFDDRKPAWNALFALAGTGPPLHAGIVVRRSDGHLAVLEAGPDDTIWVTLLRLDLRLPRFLRDFDGVITIRRRKGPLAPGRSLALAHFAQRQEGKRYAVLRLLAQGTPFRARGPWPLAAAKTYLDRDAWFCSELAVAAASVAGLIDPDAVPANTAYPRDLVEDTRFDLSANYRPAEAWRPVTRR